MNATGEPASTRDQRAIARVLRDHDTVDLPETFARDVARRAEARRDATAPIDRWLVAIAAVLLAGVAALTVISDAEAWRGVVAQSVALIDALAQPWLVLAAACAFVSALIGASAPEHPIR